MDVNPTKEKKQTNVRSAAADEAIRLTPPLLLSLEQALEFISDDECVEVTPKAVRLRKVVLDQATRGRQRSRARKAGAEPRASSTTGAPARSARLRAELRGEGSNLQHLAPKASVLPIELPRNGRTAPADGGHRLPPGRPCPPHCDRSEAAPTAGYVRGQPCHGQSGTAPIGSRPDEGTRRR